MKIFKKQKFMITYITTYGWEKTKVIEAKTQKQAFEEFINSLYYFTDIKKVELMTE